VLDDAAVEEYSLLRGNGTPDCLGSVGVAGTRADWVAAAVAATGLACLAWMSTRRGLGAAVRQLGRSTSRGSIGPSSVG